jgi:hypothetical protein
MGEYFSVNYGNSSADNSWGFRDGTSGAMLLIAEVVPNENTCSSEITGPRKWEIRCVLSTGGLTSRTKSLHCNNIYFLLIVVIISEIFCANL